MVPYKIIICWGWCSWNYAKNRDGERRSW